MLRLAEQAMHKAYVPYVNFPVGVCLQSDKGNFYMGCNVQNCALPECFCAETAAIAAMVTAGDRKVSSVLVMTPEGETLPCGGCRQKLLEFSDDKTVLHIANPGKIIKSMKFYDIVPCPFSPASLNKTSS